MTVDLPQGSRVALLVPGSARTSTWCSRCSRAASSPSRWTRPSPRPSAAGSWRPSHRTSRRRPRRRGQPAGGRGREHGPEALAPPRPPDALHERHDRHPQGRRLGAAPPEQAADLVAEERDLWGFCADDVNLVLSPLHHSAPLRFATGTLLAGGRIVVPGRFDPAAVTEAITTERPTTMFCVPTHLQRLFAHWDEVGVPDLSASAWSPTRRAVPARRQAAADRAVPGRVDLGVLRLHRGPVHRLPLRGVARPPRHRRPGPPRAHHHHGRRRDPVVRGAAARALRLRRGARPDRRRLARHPRRAGVHRRGRRPRRRRRLRVPRGAAYGPDHQRRRQRLPARGRAGGPRGAGSRRRRGVRARRRGLGPAGVRRGRRHRVDRRPRRLRPGALAPAKRPKTWAHVADSR